MTDQPGAVILCGGRSSRMEQDKTTLPFGDASMLERVVQLVTSVVPADRVVIVAAQGQQLPSLPDSLKIDCDPTPFPGPLTALGVGLAAQAGSSEYAFVCGCDSPLLKPEVIELLHQESQGWDAAVVGNEERLFPLTAFYRTSLAPKILERLQQEDKSLHALVRSINAKIVSLQAVREVDPKLQSLVNVNSMADYQAALAQAGLA